ncbi:MAG: WhiB family transcriptional regulator [Acidimicrobiales bacterium]
MDGQRSLPGECDVYALEDPELAGAWGGTSERERKSMRRQVA